MILQTCCAFITTPPVLFTSGDVEIDIELLYKAVPQLAKVFRIIDKIGEGRVHILSAEKKLFSG